MGEIDIKVYLQVLVHNWWKILLPALIAGGIALYLGTQQPELYEATAKILFTRIRPKLELADQYPTVDQLYYYARSNNPMDTIAAIAESEEIAVNTTTALNQRNIEIDWSNENTKGGISTSIDGDILNITATSRNQETPVELANEWAVQTVKQVNSVYSGERLFTEIENIIELANQDYLHSQEELEDFLSDSNIVFLENQIEESKNLLSKINQQRDQKFDYYNGRIQNLDRSLDQLTLLKKQIGSGNQSNAGDFGDALAVINARLDYQYDVVQNIDPENRQYVLIPQNIDLDLILDNPDEFIDASSNYIKDIDALIISLEEEKAKVEREFEILIKDIVSNRSDNDIEELSDNISKMEAQFERESAIVKELESKRDLAITTHQTLLEKEAELRNTSLMNNIVTVAAFAFEPKEYTLSSSLLRVVIATLFGAGIGVIWVLGEFWWKSRRQEIS
jgi:capsular polysaccharide biosynthesis protein